MPISTDSLLLRLQPPSPINVPNNLFGGGGSSMEREKLKLMRERFEEEKRQNKQQEELNRLLESGRMAREQLKGEQEQAKREAEVKAKQQADRQLAYQKFTELNAKGDIEGARAMVPFMSSLGMGVDLEGEEGGMPRYRIEMDAEEAARRDAETGALGPQPGAEMGIDRIGYPTDDTGVLDEPAGIASTEDAFNQALGASKYAELNGEALRQPDAPDHTGGVPKNVLDMGAIQAQTMARLNPALSGLINAYPEPYRESAQQTAQATRGLGLPATDAVEQFSKLRSGPDSLIRSEIEADAQRSRFETGQDKRDAKEAEILYNRGFNYGKEAAAKYNVEDLITGRDQTQRAMDILTNDEDSDDDTVLALISRRMGERGATTEGDIRRVTGMSAMAWLDQVKSWFEKGVQGGLPMQQKNALIGVLKEMQKSDNQRFNTYMEKVEEEASLADTNPDVARGMRAYSRLVVPSEIRKQREEQRKAKKGAGAQGSTGSVDRQKMSGRDADFDTALDEQARGAGLDPDKLRQVIRQEGGAGGAVNPRSGASGLIQFLNDDVAKSVGSTLAEIRQMSDTEQIPLVLKYLKDRGITEDSSAEDYYVAVAAPAFVGKPDDTVVYEKGSKAWEQNPAWRPADGGDITVGDIKRYGRGGKKDPASTEAQNDADMRALKLLEEAGY